MFSLTQLPVTKYRARLKALKKHIHDKNHLLPRVCTVEETRRQTMDSKTPWLQNSPGD